MDGFVFVDEEAFYELMVSLNEDPNRALHPAPGDGQGNPYHDGVCQAIEYGVQDYAGAGMGPFGEDWVAARHKRKIFDAGHNERGEFDVVALVKDAHGGKEYFYTSVTTVGRVGAAVSSASQSEYLMREACPTCTVVFDAGKGPWGRDVIEAGTEMHPLPAGATTTDYLVVYVGSDIVLAQNFGYGWGYVVYQDVGPPSFMDRVGNFIMGSAMLVATIVEDVYTGGYGVLDDPMSLAAATDYLVEAFK